MGSLLVSRSDGSKQMMSYESKRLMAIQRDGHVVSRSRVRSRLLSARSRRCSSFSVEKDVEVCPGRRRRSVSCSIHSKRRDSSSSNNEMIAATAASSTLTWSPLPERKANSASDNLCVALFCDDTWANIEQFENLIDSLPGNDLPTPSHSASSGTLKRRAAAAAAETTDIFGSFEEDEHNFTSLQDDISNENNFDSPQLSMRPYTNPRDTPTHHPPLLQSPSRKITNIGREDLTLESLHDLGWLHRMEPNDQVILEVHIIWSILTLMVVLLACYSLQHHSP